MSADTSCPRLIAVMGATGTGKSKFINLITSSQFGVGQGLKSCTAEVAESSPVQTRYGQVALVDTPGFDDTTVSDEVILAKIAAYLEDLYKRRRVLSGVIYLHRITDRKLCGSSRKNLNVFRHLCGDDSLSNVAIVTNMWENVEPALGIAREKELASEETMFAPLITRGARMFRHDGSRTSALTVLDKLLVKIPIPLLIQKELVDEGRDITDTSAAREIDRELAKARQKYREELASIKARIEEALREDDPETRQENEQDYEEVRRRLNAAEATLTNLSPYFAKERSVLQRNATKQVDTEKKVLRTRIDGTTSGGSSFIEASKEPEDIKVHVLDVNTDVSKRIAVMEEQIDMLKRIHEGKCTCSEQVSGRPPRSAGKNGIISMVPSLFYGVKVLLVGGRRVLLTTEDPGGAGPGRGVMERHIGSCWQYL
ncbi:hypothetical protein QCA50_014297 [Cerrena zonata]|uniref:G domain-containing protein n=1 Tax=Cerrena zonata TaxID=2478898 RepID=A0AAW0FYY4_9APHY